LSDPFSKVNEYSRAGAWDFCIDAFDGSRLLVVGSFDLCYYYDVEISFLDVTYINCPIIFHAPKFMVSEGNDEEKRYIIESDDGMFEISAAGVEVKIGKVYPSPGRRAALQRKEIDVVVIKFSDPDTDKRALGFLMGRFSGRVLRTGEVIVPEAALGALAEENYSFTVLGKPTYEQMAAFRGPPSSPSKRRKPRSSRATGRSSA
jgi:hypothetical protein